MKAAPPTLATHIYQACLLLYPSAFRLRFGDEMTSDFDTWTHDAWDARGWLGVLAFWSFAGADLLRTAATQWVRTGMPTVIMLSAMLSTMMCTLIAQQLAPKGAKLASLIPPKSDDQEVVIMLVASAVVVLVITTTIIVTGCFWMFVVRRRARA